MPGRLFAVIPAAGLSSRMGRPKLLLSLGGKTVIRRLLESLDQAGVAERIVVLREDDDDLRREVDSAGATAVQPGVDPPDMRRSVEHGLESLRQTVQPEPDDGWLLLPADHPVLDAAILRRIIAAWRKTDAPILVPTHDGRRGHPTLFRWSLADAVREIPPDRGLNELLRQSGDDVFEFAVNDPCILADLDTPQDFERIRREFEK